MPRARSLALLCTLVAALVALLLWLLRSDGAIVAFDGTEEPQRAAQGGRDAPARVESSDPLAPAADSERVAGGRIGAPRLPERAALDAATARVAGWLRPAGERGWSDAWVALVSRDGDAMPMLLAESRVEVDGGFAVELRGLPDRAGLLVEARGFRPALVDVSLRAGEELVLEDLELDRGAEIAGALSTGKQALGRFEVVAIDPRELARNSSKAGELVWDGQRFDWRFTTAESDAQGHYAIRGLRGGEYGVRVATCRGPFASLCTGDRPPRSVLAPASDVDFSFESSRLELAFTHAGEPVPEVDVELSSGTWHTGRRSDAQGHCSFELVPRLDCDLVATKKGYVPLRLPVASPASGGRAEQSFTLEIEPPAPAVRFRLSAAKGEEPDSLRVLLFAPGTPTSAAPAHTQLILLASGREAHGPVREFLFEHAPPGRWQACLIPGPGFTGSTAPESYIGTHCIVQMELTIPEHGELRSELFVQRRAALRIDLRENGGVYPSGRCTLRSPESGQELPLVLVDPRVGAPLATRELSIEGPTLLYSATCSGRALLTVDRDGQVILQQNVEFLPGEITPVTLPR